MAIVILGGLATSTLLNLFVVLALYLRFEDGTATAAEPVEPSSRRQAAVDTSDYVRGR